MRRSLVILILVLTTACSRPLTEGEAGFAGALFGDRFDTGSVSVAAGVVPLPLPPPPAAWRFRAARPRATVCQRDRPRVRSQPPVAFALGERLAYLGGTYTADAMIGWPQKVRVPHAILLAHELTHVWQWQNRAVTGYSPFKAMLESWRTTDPYFYRIEPGRPFLGYRYEQQAAMVQDYVCYRLFRPHAERLAELRAVLAPVFPLHRLEAALAR